MSSPTTTFETDRQFVVPLPTSTALSVPADKKGQPLYHVDFNVMPGQLLRGATDDEGKNKSATLLVGIKVDLEAKVHLTARVKGDLCIGLY